MGSARGAIADTADHGPGPDAPFLQRIQEPGQPFLWHGDEQPAGGLGVRKAAGAGSQ